MCPISLMRAGFGEKPRDERRKDIRLEWRQIAAIEACDAGELAEALDEAPYIAA